MREALKRAMQRRSPRTTKQRSCDRFSSLSLTLLSIQSAITHRRLLACIRRATMHRDAILLYTLGCQVFLRGYAFRKETSYETRNSNPKNGETFCMIFLLCFTANGFTCVSLHAN